MKINRLLEITTILLNRGTVTATELADRFGVSTRTIYRDIDVLSSSGVPVYGVQGANGGISLLENYSLNRTTLSGKEAESILFALQTLQSTKFPEIELILDKLGSLFKNATTDWVSIDFSPWGSNPNAYNKFVNVKNAIMHGQIIEVEYINSTNIKSHRKIEPLRLIFKYQAWYLWGFCCERQDYRTFRISRIKKLEVTDEKFDRNKLHETPKDDHTEVDNEKPLVHVVLQFTQEALYRLYDDYDDDFITKNDDGTYTLEIDFPEDEWVYGYILSFGSFVKVISPQHIKDIIKEKAENLLHYYK